MTTTNTQKATCETCPSWAAGEGNDARYQREHGETIDMGECRRTLPAVFRDEQDFAWTHWPETGSEQWCGEHPER